MPDSELGLHVVITLRAKRPRNRDSSPGTGRKLFLSEEVESDPEAHTYPYSIQPSRLSPGITRLGRESDQSPIL